MMKNKHIIVIISIVAMVLLAYVYPFMVGGGVNVYQVILLALLVLLVIPVLIKKAKGILAYIYHLILLIVFVMNMVQADALASRLSFMFIAVPSSIIYSILLATGKIDKYVFCIKSWNT